MRDDLAAEQRLNDDVARAARREAQRQSRKLLRELREVDRHRAEARRKVARHRAAIGSLVVRLVPEWTMAEVAGAVLDSRSRAAKSATVRVAFRRYGEQHLGGRRATPVPEPQKEVKLPEVEVVGLSGLAPASTEEDRAKLAAAMGIDHPDWPFE